MIQGIGVAPSVKRRWKAAKYATEKQPQVDADNLS
jgi:hypothetical protein